jgi:hypothetical protein
MDLPLGQLSRPEKLFQHWGVAGILELRVEVVSDEIKEGLEIGETGVLGDLVAGVIEAGEKGEYLFRGYGIQFSVRKMVSKFAQE